MTVVDPGYIKSVGAYPFYVLPGELALYQKSNLDERRSDHKAQIVTEILFPFWVVLLCSALGFLLLLGCITGLFLLCKAP